MKIIKFRAWYPGKKIMTYSDQSNWGAFGDCELSDYSSGICEIMQFTGLLDKNGKEIYEGDLIRQRKNLGMSQVWCIGKIVFKDGSFIIDWQPEKNGDIHYSETLKYHAPDSEIIGNIYANKQQP